MIEVLSALDSLELIGTHPCAPPGLRCMGNGAQRDLCFVGDLTRCLKRGWTKAEGPFLVLVLVLKVLVRFRWGACPSPDSLFGPLLYMEQPFGNAAQHNVCPWACGRGTSAFGTNISLFSTSQARCKEEKKKRKEEMLYLSGAKISLNEIHEAMLFFTW